jgi:hypothetical protein
MAASLQAFAATGTAYLTAADGQELMDGGLIAVSAPPQASPENPAAFLCTITDAGKQMLAAGIAPHAPVAPATPVVEAGQEFVISSDIAVPDINRGGGSGSSRKKRAEKYPFSKLEIGQSFHVAPGEDIDKTARTLSTQVSNANKDNRVPAVPAAEKTVTKRRMVKDDAGNAVKDATGTKVFETYKVKETVMVRQKHFVSRKVPASDPQGEGIRVFRIAITTT